MKTLFMTGLVVLLVFFLYGKQLPVGGELPKTLMTAIEKKKESLVSGPSEPTEKPAAPAGSEGIGAPAPLQPSAESIEKIGGAVQSQKGFFNVQQTVVDPEIAEALNEAKKDDVVIINPLVEKLLAMDKADMDLAKKFNPEKSMILLFLKIRSLQGTIAAACVISAVCLVLFMTALRNSGLSGLLLLLSRTGFGLSRFVLFASALTAAIARFAFGYDFFTDAGYLILGVIFLLAASATSMKLYDYNSPVWNRMFLSMFWPIASGAAVRFF